MADKDERKHDASAQKLMRLKKEGKLPESPEFISSISLFLFSVAFFELAGQFGIIWSKDIWLHLRVGPENPDYFTIENVLRSNEILIVIMLIPIFSVLVMGFCIKGGAIQFGNITLKWGKLNPIGNFRSKFGSKALMQFSRDLLKSVIVFVIGVLLALVFLDRVGASLLQGLSWQIYNYFNNLRAYLVLFSILFMLFGCVDYLLKRHYFIKENMMTDQEVKDEHKDNEGSPEVKQKRRQRAYEISSSRMMQDAREADVLIVNPVHIAVALRWSREKGSAPVCVAKGQDLVAQRIKEIASESGIPVHQDVPTARALHSVCDVGDEVPPELYAAVAIAIRFADSLRERSRKSPFGAGHDVG